MRVAVIDAEKGVGRAAHELVRSYIEPSDRADESLKFNTPKHDERMRLVLKND